MANRAWATDVQVSLPAASDVDFGVDVGDGWTMTPSGLRHKITQQTIDAMTPTYGPVADPRLPVHETVPDGKEGPGGN